MKQDSLYPLRNTYLNNKAFSRYYLNGAIGALASTLGALVDGIIVGRYLGSASFAAINVVAPILLIIKALFLLTAQSSAVMIGNAIGKQDKAGAKSVFSTALLWNLIFGVVFCLIGVLFLQPIIVTICPSVELRILVKDYLQIVIWSSPLYILLPGLCYFIRSDANPRMATLAMVMANVINLLLDVVFIKYLGMGIEGAAWATMVGFAVGVLMACSHFFRKERVLALVRPNFRKYSHAILTSPIPVLLILFSTSLSVMLANIIIMKNVGQEGIVTMSVCYSVYSFALMLNLTNNQTFLPMAGILRGFGDERGVHFTLKKAFRTICVLMSVYMVLILLFPREIINLFSVENVSDIMIGRVRIYALCLIGFACVFYFMSVYVSIKRFWLAYYIVVMKAFLPIALMLLFCARGLTSQLWWSYPLGYSLLFLSLLLISYLIRKKDKDMMPLWLEKKPSPNTDDDFNFSVPAKIDGLRNALTYIRNKVDEHPLVSPQQAYTVDLCCDELISNIIKFGYSSRPENHFIDIFIKVTPQKVTACIRDDGKCFNPLRFEDDTTIGLLLVKKLCHRADYTFSMNQNIITIEALRDSE